MSLQELHKPTSVFIADDDTDDVYLVKSALGQLVEDVNIKHFLNGRELLRGLNEEHELPNFVLLDLNMPILDGKETLRQIRRNNQLRNLPVIILSTCRQKEEQEICLSYGATHYFIKPCQFATYLEIFRQLKSELIDRMTV